MADVRMGKSLIRAKKKRQLQNRANFQAILEQEHRQHIEQETAPKLQSVWHTSNLDDVIEAAGEREEGYMALRDVRVVIAGTTHVMSGDKVVPQSVDDRDWFGLSAQLPIPERPRWNFRMKADEVQQQEKMAFVEWRRDLARVEERDRIVMTPFEKNVEVWRQLWRVVEKSDVVLQIVDARNPLAFRSAGFERYVAKHTTKLGKPKPVILLLNKADLLTELQRKAWAQYFKSKGIPFYFFSARASSEAAEAAAIDAAAAAQHKDPTAAAATEEEGDAASNDEEEEEEPAVEPEMKQVGKRRPAAATASSASKLDREQYMEEAAKRAAEAQAAAAASSKKGRRRQDKKVSGAPQKLDNPYAIKSLKDDAEDRRIAREEEKAKERPMTQEELERDRRLREDIRARFQPWDLLDPITLLDMLAVMRAELGVTTEAPVMVGLTGYPNVGKSSTINAIMQTKRVVVSATPGKTKHFQTLAIPNERRLMLCDCPGLVFPSFATTKESMVCDGILPVDTCRDYLAAVGVVCSRIPRGVLERQYIIVIEEDLDVDLSASKQELFLNLLSRRKGFMSDHDKPNRYRSAHIVLKDYVDGKVVYAHPPPGLVIEDPTPPAPSTKPSAAGTKRSAGGDGDKRGAARGAAAKGGRMGITARQQPDAEEEEGDDDEDGWETDGSDDVADAPRAAGADDDDGGWETASDDGEADEAWEEFDGAEADRHLSDDEDSVMSEDDYEPLSFYGTTNGSERRALTTAEIFNLERNQGIVDAPVERSRPKKKKVNPMLVPDESVRINRHGEKELLLDEDDDIVICGEEAVEEKKVSKRTERRQRKRGVVAARGAKPAALPGQYEARTGEVA